MGTDAHPAVALWFGLSRGEGVPQQIESDLHDLHPDEALSQIWGTGVAFRKWRVPVGFVIQSGSSCHDFG